MFLNHIIYYVVYERKHINTFEIKTNNNAGDHFYIQKASLGGENLDRPWIGHDEIMNGSSLLLNMGKEPNKSRSTDPKNAPYSMSKDFK